MPTLYEATTPIDGVLTVPEGWRQGRGAYGGLSIAALVRAIEAHVGDPARKVRSVTAELPAPTVPGVARVAVDVLRSGSNLTVARASLHQDDTVTSHAVAILATDRRDIDISHCELVPPAAPPWTEIQPIPMDRGPAWPEFAHHFEYRLVSGMPFAGENTSTVVGYVSAREPGDARDAAYIAAMIDVWWPGLFGMMRKPRPMATIAFTLELLDTLEGADPAAPLLYRGTVPVVRGGYFVETRELWTPDGRLIARNHQTFAIIK
jgi:acyl-CoA thioesterase